MLAFLAEFPPQIQDRVVCGIAAATRYQVPANIVLAVAEKEGGKPGQWVRNSNGTHDVGPMQFNTAYLAGLNRYGITASDVAAAGCYSFDLAAWRLARHLRDDKGDMWTRAANYHSRTPYFNALYRADLMRKAVKWGNWLETHFVTRDMTVDGAISQPGAAPWGVRQAPSRVMAAAAMPVKVQPGTGSAVYVPRRISFNTHQDGEAW